MSTPNKFSNPDVPACDCLRLYANCLIIGPLQAIFCLPCVCCARAHKDHEKQRQIDGISQTKGHREREESQATVEDQPSQQPDMTMLLDASKPKDQWPAEWAHGHAKQESNGVKGDGTRAAEVEGTGDRTVKDKLADGVLTISTALL
ncbi:hypothetical protein E0Z10_g8586 [Xylaria hypoxylon]|uniref:Uncharacterized protein n=1 Tax=Xylaria hypoxylon TaxID=37992 RepID=A0A4Z0YLW3_9PEZI|nr:hypothetical protein E0Z10_g8586 [Xylaria hypoxylon]